ncbi:MAG: hypothetical protein A2X78_02600 [Gammaproteobacteria bacterium GWE2_37_16]|nr:MAG: hypothetical protein A2X78_02600 [Gammaproteobacteria bacterium GWE2_37_16]
MAIREELITMLNQALKLEHAAEIQYLNHAKMIKGLNALPIIAQLEEIAGDEHKHAEKFRNLITNCLNGEPTMDMTETHRAQDLHAILEVNLKDEKTAIEFYKQIYHKIVDNKADLYYFETLEHEVRHIIIDEQEHTIELSTLLGL